MCSNNLIRLFKFLGNIMKILKIVIPIILIIVIAIEILKYIFNPKEKIINKLIKKIIVTVIVFFIPMIIYFILNMLSIDTDNLCIKCFKDPNSSECVIVEDNDVQKITPTQDYSELEEELKISHMSAGKIYEDKNIGDVTCPIWFDKLENEDEYTSLRACNYINSFSECGTNYLDESKWQIIDNNINSSYIGDTKYIVYVAFNIKEQKWVKSETYNVKYNPVMVEPYSEGTLKLNFCSKYKDYGTNTNIEVKENDTVLIINGSNYDIKNSWYQFSINGEEYTDFGEEKKNTIMNYFSFPFNNMNEANIKWRVKTNNSWIESEIYNLKVGS